MSSTSDGGSVRILLGASGPSMHLKVEFSRLAGSYALAAGWSGLAWDYCLCFRQEHKYFWKRKFGYGSFLYFMNRYFIIVNLTLQTLGLLVAPSNDLYFSSSFSLRNIDFSKGAAWVGHLAATGSFLQIIWAEATLLRRVLAILNDRHIRLKYLLIATFFAANVSGLTVTQFSVKSLTMTTQTIFGSRMCIQVDVTLGKSYELAFDFIPMIVFNIVLAGVSIHAFTREIQNSPFRRSFTKRLISAMRWQSITHFMIIFSITVITSLVFHFMPNSIGVSSTITLTVASLTSSRMLISMQDQAHLIDEDDFELEITSSVIRNCIPPTPRSSAEQSSLDTIPRQQLRNVVGK